MALTTIDDRGLKTPIDLLDSEKIRFGTGNDLEIFHDGTDSKIDNSQGDLLIRSGGGNIHIRPVNAENSILAYPNGKVELYYDNSKKFETESWGCEVHGQLHVASGGSLKVADSVQIQVGDSADLKIYHDGSNSILKNTQGQLRLAGDYFAVRNNADDEYMIYGQVNQGVNLYYDNVKKFETISAGAKVTGDFQFQGASAQWDDSESALTFADNYKIKLGSGDDLVIYHNGSDSYIQDAGTGSLVLLSHDFRLRNAAENEDMIRAYENGAVELYDNNVKKFATTSTGVKVTGIVHVDDSDKFVCGTGQDLEISFNGTNGWIDCNAGSLYIDTTADIIARVNNNEDAIKAIANGAVELYHNNTKQCETSANGLAFPSGKGIDFSAQTATSATGATTSSELLDHYEEGSWTPSFQSDQGQTPTHTTQTGTYTRIGNWVHVQFYCAWSSVLNMGSQARIGGLPYTSGNYGTGSCFLNSWNFDSEVVDIVLHHSGSNIIYLYYTRDDGSWQALPCDPNASIIGTMSYRCS